MASVYFKLNVLKRKRIVAENKEEYRKLDLKIKSSTKLPKKCRICLQEGNILIYDSTTHIDYSKFIRQLGDIEISISDKFPKYLCNACHGLLQSAILFRRKAKDSDTILRQNLNFEQDDLGSCDDGIIHGIHSDECDGESQKLYTCQPCNLTFKGWAKYVVHRNSMQHKKLRIQCPICFGLLTPQLYKKHLARHQSASHLVCEVCGKLYRKDNLLRHLQLHSYNLPYKCHLCPYKGRFMESLKIHIRTHTGDKPFSCENCHLCFLTRSNLNRHILTHKKDRPYKCIECQRGFHMKRDLDVHYKTDHVGIKDFGCKMCGNKYGTRKALMRHELRVHKRDKLAKGRMPLYMQPEYSK